ncbi:MAG: hypothetical protein ABSA79_10085 [Candidatus Bathyarchaeia archaeon]|jgi:hypothetical protein
MERRINWFGLAAGITTLLVLVVSLFVPWWQLTIGDKLLQVNASPMNTNFGLLNLKFTVPLLWAWNLVSVFIFVAAGVVMLVYSIFPTRSYSKELLGFSYKKPLYILISFFIGLIVMISIASVIGFNVPAVGKSNIALPSQFMPSGLSISAFVSAGFQFPFYLAIAAAALCIVARLYHGRVVKTTELSPAVANATAPI